MKALRITCLPIVIAIAVSGCAAVPLPLSERADLEAQAREAPTSVPGSMANKTPTTLATMETYQYLRIDPEKTGVLNAADDGRYTYLAFEPRQNDPLSFFDQDGEPLTFARAGAIVALPGIYKGILVRASQAENSYIAPNPRASAADRPNLEGDPEIIEARTKLEVASTQLPAFRRAMRRADEKTKQEIAPSSAPTPPVDDPTYQRTANGVLMRVFFASGGRVIVRPDDGLVRLEAEAKNASEIRISGYTDSIGSDAVNSALAQARAEAIRSLLVKRGIPAERILVTWAGNTRYLADNATALGRAMNRRVEVEFVHGGRN